MDCRFENVYSGVGAYGAVIGSYFRNIVIENNTFINITDKAVSAFNFSNVSSKFDTNFSDLSEKLFKLDEKKLRIIAGIIILVLLISAILPVVIVNQRLDKVRKEYKAMEIDLKKLKDEQSEVDRLLREQNYLSKFTNLSEELRKYKILYSKLIIVLLSLVPEEIYITDVTFKIDDNNMNTNNASIEINGHADKSDNVFLFQSQINQSKIFVNPDVISANEETIDSERYFIKFIIRSAIDLKELYLDKDSNKDKTEDDKNDEEEDEEGEEGEE